MIEENNYTYHNPQLSEKGKETTKKILEDFKVEMFRIINETMYAVTCNISEEIVDDDLWINLRNEIKACFLDYGKYGKGLGERQFYANLREKIFQEHKEDIAFQLVAKKEKEIISLMETIDRLNRF